MFLPFEHQDNTKPIERKQHKIFYNVLSGKVHCILKKDVGYYFFYEDDTFKFSFVDVIVKNVLLSVEKHVTFGHTDFAPEKSLGSSKKA